MRILLRFHEVEIEMLNPLEEGESFRIKVGILGLAMVLAFHLVSVCQYEFMIDGLTVFARSST